MGQTTKLDSNFYAPETDDDVFIEMAKFVRAKAGYNVPKEVTSLEIGRYLSQLANLAAKYISILSGREIGDMHDPRLYELPDAGRDMWRSDWDRSDRDPYSLGIADSVVKLSNLKTLINSWAFPSGLQADIIDLFTAKKLTGEGNSPIVGFVPSRISSVNASGSEEGLRLFESIPSLDVLSDYAPDDYEWINRRSIRSGAGFYVPASARSLEIEVNAFRRNRINTLVHSALSSKALSLPNLSLPDTLGIGSASGRWLLLWQMGGVTHGSAGGFVIPNSGASEYDLRVRVPIWAAGSIDAGFTPWWTHGFGDQWSGVAGRALVNNYIAARSGTISTAGRLPTVVWYHHDPRKDPVRNQIEGVLDLSESGDALGMFPLDRFQLGWKNLVHFPERISRGISEVGLLPANRAMGKLYFADTARFRKDSWLMWRSLLGFPS